MRRHVDAQHNDQITYWTCKICYVACQNDKELTDHMTKQHPNKEYPLKST